MSLFHESLQRTLTGATLSGFVARAEHGKSPRIDVAVLIERVAKSKAIHDWTLDVVVAPDGDARKYSVTCDVRWAGPTPVLTINRADLPGIGQFSAKLIIHNCLVAGTWVHDDLRGHAWGMVDSPHEGKHRRRFVIERSSEFLREWWTENGWSKECSDAKWYEHEPDGPGESGDEGAHAVCYPSGEVEPG